MRLKPYLSYTQLVTLEASEKRYIEHYIHGKPMFENDGMRLGKEVADSLESGEETGDIMKDFVIALFPKLELMDNTFETTITVSGVRIPLLSKLDSAKKDLSAFYEYKTGSTPWSQGKVDKHCQIDFYCVVAHQLTGKIPEEIKLFHAPTEKDEYGCPKLTGEVIPYRTKRTLTDILKMKIRMHRAWQRIEELVNQELL